MPEKKQTNRSFEAELRSLPIELVPPDPQGLERPAKVRQLPVHQPGQPGLENERSLLDKLIDRIKRI